MESAGGSGRRCDGGIDILIGSRHCRIRMALSRLTGMTVHNGRRSVRVDRTVSRKFSMFHMRITSIFVVFLGAC
jgi:hypothetical protein